MPTQLFGTRGFDHPYHSSITSDSTDDSADHSSFTDDSPSVTDDSSRAFTPVEGFVATRGWSCAKDRKNGQPLSPRERQILTLIIDGKTRKEVAYDLEIAHSTVRVIYSRAMKKLGGHWAPLGRR